MSYGIVVNGKRNPAERRRNPGPIFKYQHKQIKRLWKAGIRVFLDTALRDILVPLVPSTYTTGMSAASLAPLGKMVGMKTAILAAIHGNGPRPGNRHLIGEWASNNDGYKSKERGVRLGEKAFHLTFGTPKRPVVTFEFHIVIFQYYLHEFGLVEHTSGPWNSLNDGMLAMQVFVENNWKSYIPNLAEYLINGELKAGI